jgi:excisionase family DNA binding protein
MGDQIMTVKEVAAYLKLNERAVYRMATASKIPAFKVGASWRFRQAEIERWITEQHNLFQNSMSDIL